MKHTPLLSEIFKRNEFKRIHVRNLEDQDEESDVTGGRPTDHLLVW